MSKEELPSIDDEIISDLPSVEDFITEENAEELPSVEEYIEKEEVVETVEEVVEQPTDLTEIVRLINDVRKDIPDIPEVKYYDVELEKLCEIVDQVRSEIPEVKSYDSEIEAICDEIDLVKENIQDLPEVKYYDEQVTLIEDRIDTLQTEVTNLPEVKYYDKEIEAICEAIDAVKSQIPKFPKWVNEVNEVPDFSWIGKTFSVIDDDFIKVNDTIDGLKTKVDFDLNELSEDIYKKHFENSVKVDAEVTSLDEKVNTRIDEEKDKIWKELRSSSLKIWEYHKEFKDDDKKLKKQVLGEYNTLKQNIKKELKEINYSSIKTDELLLKYFNELKGEISSLPEVKYYDEDLRHVRSDIKGLYKLVEDIKETNKKLQEEQQLLAETNVPLSEDPPGTKNPDPLTPLDQNFVTLDQLQKHYKIFVERVQYQLASIGGGGETRLRYLDDIVGIATNLSAYDGMYLGIDASNSAQPFVFSSVSGGGGTGAGGTWSNYDSNTGVTTTKKVKIQNNLEVTGVTTSTGGFVGNLTGTATGLSGTPDITIRNITGVAATFTGVLTYEDVTNIDSIGLITARSGIKVLDEGIHVVGVSTISTGVGTVHVGVGSTALLVDGDARVTGILTIGSGSITLDPTAKKIEGIDEIIIGTGTTVRIHQDTSGEIAFSDRDGKQASVGIGTTVSINTTGIITASSFRGDGSQLTNIISGVGIQSAGSLIGTASTINFTAGSVSVSNDIASVSVGSSIRFVGARMYHDDYSVTASGSWTAVTNFDGTSIDTNSFANTTNGTFTIPAGVSKVKISTNVRAVANGNTNNQWQTYKNGSVLAVIDGGFNIDLDGTSGYSNPGTFGQTAIISVVEGDYFNLRYFVSNTNLDVDLWYQIEVVEGSLLGHYFASTNVTNADNITVQANNSTNEIVYPVFVDGATGVQGPETDTGLMYNPSTGILSTTTFSGNLDLNNNFITGTGGVNVTGVVTATTFSGSGASLTSIPNGALTNSSITIGGVTLNLGDTDATPAFNLSDATAYPYTSLTGITTEIVGDTTPQLGGNLDLNSKFITGTGGINVTGVVTATSFTGSGANLTNLTGASAATYGDASNVAQIVVDADGRITSISEVTISGGGGGGSGPDPVIMGMIF